MAKQYITFKGVKQVINRLHKINNGIPEVFRRELDKTAEELSEYAQNYLYTETLFHNKSLSQDDRAAMGKNAHSSIGDSWDWKSKQKVNKNLVSVTLGNTSEHAAVQEFGCGQIISHSKGMTFQYRGKMYYNMLSTSGIPAIGYLNHAVGELTRQTYPLNEMSCSLIEYLMNSLD